MVYYILLFYVYKKKSPRKFYIVQDNYFISLSHVQLSSKLI